MLKAKNERSASTGAKIGVRAGIVAVNTLRTVLLDLNTTDKKRYCIENFHWFIAIEDTKDDGLGVFVAKDDLVELFQKNYPHLFT